MCAPMTQLLQLVIYFMQNTKDIVLIMSSDLTYFLTSPYLNMYLILTISNFNALERGIIRAISLMSFAKQK